MTQPYVMVITSAIAFLLLVLFILFVTYVYPKKKLNIIVLLLLISILPVISIFRPGTYYAGDLTIHTVFLQSFYENLQNGILIPRWAGGLCAGYGCPVFMFEYIFPYYLGAFFHLFGFSFLTSMKLFLAAAYLLSGLTMYLFVRDEYNKTQAFIAAILYLFAPVRFIEMHFRVSVGIDASFIFIPLTFLLAKKSLSGKPLYIVLGAINFVFVMFAHSSVALITVPAAVFYAFIKRKNNRDIIFPVLSYVLGAGLAAYYILPALFEIKYTWYNPNIAPDIHFFPFFWYIFSPAGYGFLFQGHMGELRPLIGYTQLGIILLALYAVVKNKFQKQEKKVVLYLLSYFFVCFLLTQSFTKVLWVNFFLLRSFILTWRMLVPIAFISAFLGAIITKNWNKKILIVFCVITILITILNWGNRKMTALMPDAYFTNWSLYSQYIDPSNPVFLTRYKKEAPDVITLALQRPLSHLEILSGRGEIKEIKRTQIYHEYLVHADTKLLLSESTFYFPGWNVYVNGNRVPVNIMNKKSFNTLTFGVQKGLYDIQAKFQDTPITRISTSISLFSLGILVLLICIIFFKWIF